MKYYKRGFDVLVPKALSTDDVNQWPQRLQKGEMVQLPPVATHEYMERRARHKPGGVLADTLDLYPNNDSLGVRSAFLELFVTQL